MPLEFRKALLRNVRFISISLKTVEELTGTFHYPFSFEALWPFEFFGYCTSIKQVDFNIPAKLIRSCILPQGRVKSNKIFMQHAWKLMRQPILIPLNLIRIGTGRRLEVEAYNGFKIKVVRMGH